MTIMGMSLMIFPMLPSTVSKGEKAAIDVRIAKMTGTYTSCAPSIAARKPRLPIW